MGSPAHQVPLGLISRIGRPAPKSGHTGSFPPATPDHPSFLTASLMLVSFCFVLLFVIVAVLRAIR